VAARADNPAHPPAFDQAVLAKLACPACLGDLHLEGAHLSCIACRRSYAIVDGIPVLIIDRADRPNEER